jgi:hypothetical protein
MSSHDKVGLSSGYTLRLGDLMTPDEAYESALDSATLEIFRGKYTAEEIRSMIDRADILRMAFAKIEEQLQSGAP